MISAFIDTDCTNFSHLMYRLPGLNEQRKYTESWRRRYAKHMSDSYAEYVWAVRTHKSLKEAFTSVCFYQESLIAKESNCWPSFYFLSYYSIFHALMSCVCFIPEETIEDLSEISHKKLINVFVSNFASAEPKIIRGDIGDLFQMLKYLREYYSYKMPPNDFLYDNKETIKPDTAIPYFIRSCCQLASLHSELIVRSEAKAWKSRETSDDFPLKVREWYSILNCPRHPTSGEYILDYTDQHKIFEIVSGIGPVSFVTDFEHFVDEFRTCSGSNFPVSRSGEVVNPQAFMYRVLFR